MSTGILKTQKPPLDPTYRTKVLGLLNERHGSALRAERFELDAIRDALSEKPACAPKKRPLAALAALAPRYEAR